jgi:hypothetical protein
VRRIVPIALVIGLGLASSAGLAGVAAAETLCPDGSYVAGQRCTLAPDGTYVGGRPQLAPNGRYVGGKPRLAPNNTYIGQGGEAPGPGVSALPGPHTLLCPDGSYAYGRRCKLTPGGRYVGE